MKSVAGEGTRCRWRDWQGSWGRRGLWFSSNRHTVIDKWLNWICVSRHHCYQLLWLWRLCQKLRTLMMRLFNAEAALPAQCANRQCPQTVVTCSPLYCTASGSTIVLSRSDTLQSFWIWCCSKDTLKSNMSRESSAYGQKFTHAYLMLFVFLLLFSFAFQTSNK